MKGLFYILGTLIILLGLGTLWLSLSMPVLEANFWAIIILMGVVFLCAAGIMGSIEQLLPKTDYKALAAQKAAAEKAAGQDKP